MKKIKTIKTIFFLVVLSCVLCTLANVSAVSVSVETTYSTKDITEGLDAANFKAVDYQGNELEVGTGQFISSTGLITYELCALNDGYESSWSSIATYDAEGNKTLGWFIMDFGQVYCINQIMVTMQHSWSGVDVVVQVATKEDFSDAITIYNNDIDNSLGLGSTFTADSDVAVDERLSNHGENGNTTSKNGNIWNFDPVNARYIRVTNNQYGDGILRGFTACAEINVVAVGLAQ